MVSMFHLKSQNEIPHFIELLPKNHDQEPLSQLFVIFCFIFQPKRIR